MNMSYVRFENTDRDLADCEHALREFLDGGRGASDPTDEKLSETETAAAVRLIRRCDRIARMVRDELDFEHVTVLDEEPISITNMIEETNAKYDAMAEDRSNEDPIEYRGSGAR